MADWLCEHNADCLWNEYDNVDWLWEHNVMDCGMILYFVIFNCAL